MACLGCPMKMFVQLGMAGTLALSAALTVLVAPARAQAYEESAFSSCSGKGCCLKGGTNMGQTCVKITTLAVRSADNQSLAKVRLVQKDTKDGRLWGLADEGGRILISPQYSMVHPISTKAAWAARSDGKGVLLVDGKERPTIVNTVQGFQPVNGPYFIFGVTALNTGGFWDLAPLRPDGSFGPSLKRVLPREAGIAQIDGTAVLAVAMEDAATKARGTAFVDAFTGNVVWAGPETVAHQGGWGHQGACLRSPNARDYLGRSVNLVLGPSPVNLGDRRLFRPLDARGAPAPLPAGVIGLTPVLRGSGLCAPGWVVVSRVGERLEYKVGWGSPAMVMADMANLTPLDDVRLAEPTRYNDARQHSTFQINDGLVVGKASGGTVWHVTDLWSPRFAIGDKTWGASAVAAADNFIGEAWAQVLAKMADRAQREADAVALWAQEQAFFDRSIDRVSALNTADRLRVRHVALKDGGQRAQLYWSKAADRKGDAQAFCDHVPDACSAVVEKREADMASLLAYQRQRAAIDAAFAGFARGPDPDPNVKVTIYEGGRVRTEVMPQSHYENIYASKP